MCCGIECENKCKVFVQKQREKDTIIHSTVNNDLLFSAFATFSVC